MPTITVLVGQCGNQLGLSFLESLATSSRTSSASLTDEDDDDGSCQHEYFRRSGTASSSSSSSATRRAVVPRSVLVDMEPKVLEQSCLHAKDRQLFSIDAAQCVSREEGSANNWAFGYYAQGSSRLGDFERQLQLEVELASAAAPSSLPPYGAVGVYFHIVHSVAGGTGSGVGCLVSEAIADMYPKALIHHTLVWPFQHGEVVTQWYNAVLATSFLRDTADSVLVLSNEDVAKQVRSGYEGGGVQFAQGLAGASTFREINYVMADVMASLCLPSSICSTPLDGVVSDRRSRVLRHDGAPQQRLQHNSNASHHRGGGDDYHAPTATCPLRSATHYDVVEQLALDPVKKFFAGSMFPLNAVHSHHHAASVPQTSWGSTVQGCVRYAARQRSDAALFMLRGRGASSEGLRELQHSLASREGALLPLHRRGVLVSDTTFMGTSSLYESQTAAGVPLVASPRASVFACAPAFADQLEEALGKVESMLDARAFVHHYTRYGLSVDDLEDACLRCWELAAAYRIE